MINKGSSIDMGEPFSHLWTFFRFLLPCIRFFLYLCTHEETGQQETKTFLLDVFPHQYGADCGDDYPRMVIH